MRLEYLPDGSPDCPLIRLFDFRPDEAGRLGAAVADLAAGRTDRVAVHELPDVTAVDGCELVLRAGPRYGAVVQPGPAAFDCCSTAATWDNVAGLIEPFAEGRGGYQWRYQWLLDLPGEVRVLLASSGQW